MVPYQVRVPSRQAAACLRLRLLGRAPVDSRLSTRASNNYTVQSEHRRGQACFQHPHPLNTTGPRSLEGADVPMLVPKVPHHPLSARPGISLAVFSWLSLDRALGIPRSLDPCLPRSSMPPLLGTGSWAVGSFWPPPFSSLPFA